MERVRLRGPGAALLRGWGALGLRWQLVDLTISVIAVTVLLIIVLMHNIAQQQFMVIMHAAGQPVAPAAGQRAYDAAVEAQIYPTIAVAAVVAVGLSFLAVTLALRPLTAVSEATRRMARGAAPAGRLQHPSAARSTQRGRVRRRVHGARTPPGPARRQTSGADLNAAASRPADSPAARTIA